MYYVVVPMIKGMYFFSLIFWVYTLGLARRQFIKILYMMDQYEKWIFEISFKDDLILADGLDDESSRIKLKKTLTLYSSLRKDLSIHVKTSYIRKRSAISWQSGNSSRVWQVHAVTYSYKSMLLDDCQIPPLFCDLLLLLDRRK